MKRLLLMLGLLGPAGCVGPRIEVPATRPVAAELPAGASTATQPGGSAPGLPLRLGDHVILYLSEVTASLPRKSVNHLIAQQPISTSAAAGKPDSDLVSSYALMAVEPGAPLMTCQIVSHGNGRAVSVIVETRHRLPALCLTARLPPDVFPSRYHTPQGPHARQLAIGPATQLLFDSLHHESGGLYAVLDGDVSFEPAADAYVLKARASAAAGRRITLLRLELQPADPDGQRPTQTWSLRQLAPPAPIGQARRYATEWAFAPGSDAPAVPSPAEALLVLPADRAELVRRIHPKPSVRRVDRADGGVVFNVAIARPPQQWNELYLSNPSPTGSTVTVSLRQMGIAPTAAGRLAVYDFWQQQLVTLTDDVLEVDLSAGDCRVLCVRSVQPDEPCILGTSRHITHGLPDLVGVRYESRSMTLSGSSAVTGGDPYELRILVPTGRQGLEIADIDAAVASRLLRADGPLRIVTFECDTDQMVAWRIRFRRATVTAAPPSPPARLSLQQNTRGVLLKWDAGESRPVRFRIYRDGNPLATVAGSETQYQDSDVVYGSRYTYAVCAVDFSGRESEPPPPAVYATPVPANAYLTQLVPLSVEQGRPPVANRSAGGRPLRMAGRRYNRGLGTTPGTRVEYFLGEGYERFSGEVGIDDASAAKGPARFEIWGDDRLLFRSEPLAAGQKPQRFDVPVAGCRKLALAVIDADGGDGDVHADWGDTYLRASPAPGR